MKTICELCGHSFEGRGRDGFNEHERYLDCIDCMQNDIDNLVEQRNEAREYADKVDARRRDQDAEIRDKRQEIERLKKELNNLGRAAESWMIATRNARDEIDRLKSTPCLGGCGKSIDGMCRECVEGARIVNANAMGLLHSRVSYLEGRLYSANSLAQKIMLAAGDIIHPEDCDCIVCK